MSVFPRLTTVFIDTIIARLVPWFLAAAGGDLDLARQTAQALLASFDAETEEEVRLAAEIASFGFGLLEVLGTSVDPDLPLKTVLRLRGTANALQRSKNQCQRSLDKLRKERRMTQPATEDVRPAATACPAPTMPAVRPPVEATPARPQPAVALSRQQRRALQRAVDKAQRRQAELARRDAARAARAAPAAALPMAEPGQASHHCTMTA